MSNVRQIAQLAGVSIATVSYALRGDARVKPQTREQILAIAEQCHYHARVTAIPVSHRTLGLAMGSISHPFTSRVTAGVLQQAYAMEYEMMISGMACDAARLAASVISMASKSLHGVLLYSVTPVANATLYALSSRGILTVGLDCTQFDASVNLVHTDEAALADQLLAYAMGLGHRRIVYLKMATEQYPGRRETALLTAARQHGLAVTDGPLTACCLVRAQADAHLFALLRQPDAATLVICHEDQTAARVMDALQRAGWRVPQQVSIISYGNYPFSEFLNPPLTTVEQYPERIGMSAVALLARQYTAREAGQRSAPETVLLPGELIVRGSCAPPHARPH